MVDGVVSPNGLVLVKSPMKPIPQQVGQEEHEDRLHQYRLAVRPQAFPGDAGVVQDVGYCDHGQK